MKTHFSLLLGMPLAAMLVALPATALDTGAGAPAQNETIATVNGKPISQAKLDILVRERVAQGQQDSPELRSFLKQELINREVLQQESVKRGLDKNEQVVLQLEMVRLGVLVAAFLQDHLR